MPPMTHANPFHISMTHVELEAALGPDAVAKIEAANFVLVPREWRERAFAAPQETARGADESAHPSIEVVLTKDHAELLSLVERILRDPAAGGLPSEYITRATRLGVPVADL